MHKIPNAQTVILRKGTKKLSAIVLITVHAY